MSSQHDKYARARRHRKLLVLEQVVFFWRQKQFEGGFCSWAAKKDREAFGLVVVVVVFGSSSGSSRKFLVPRCTFFFCRFQLTCWPYLERLRSKLIRAE